MYILFFCVIYTEIVFLQYSFFWIFPSFLPVDAAEKD